MAHACARGDVRHSRRDARDEADQAAAHTIIALRGLCNVTSCAARAKADIAAVCRAARLRAALGQLAPERSENERGGRGGVEGGWRLENKML